MANTIDFKTGYKATNKNMKCQGFKFEIGEWYSVKGGLEPCKNGFHFCEYPSGPWAYYNNGRLFKVEAKEVLMSTGPGADLKHVARHIRLVEEIKLDGNRNTGNRNTGDRNTGGRNTGDRNTGNWNTGNRNTGAGNCGNNHSGSLCFGEAPFYLFNKKADRKKVDFSKVYDLSCLLLKDDPIDPVPFLLLPNATKTAIKKLHGEHIKSRKKANKTL